MYGAEGCKGEPTLSNANYQVSRKLSKRKDKCRQWRLRLL